MTSAEDCRFWHAGSAGWPELRSRHGLGLPHHDVVQHMKKWQQEWEAGLWLCVVWNVAGLQFECSNYYLIITVYNNNKVMRLSVRCYTIFLWWKASTFQLPIDEIAAT